MKIAVFCDMEGISGISNNEFVMADRRCYALGQQYMTMDANACIRGCFKGGAEEVLIYDGHCSGTNIIWKDLDSRAELIQGSGGEDRFDFIKDFDALILLGYHAKAGTLGGLMHHTYSSKDIQNIWLNGRAIGEFGLDAAIASDYGIPVIMTSGDDKLCIEAHEWIPEVITCEVKKGIACNKAKMLSAENAHKLIEESACQAVADKDKIKPLKVEKPATLRLEATPRGFMPRVASRPGVKRIDELILEVSGDSLENIFWQLF
ncbi:MAG: M55 family metallopeptidase [Planctomycetota bacterium]|jgi:D-amino peptidase